MKLASSGNKLPESGVVDEIRSRNYGVRVQKTAKYSNKR